MPRMCSIQGCRSNYRSENQGKGVSTFALPRDEKLKKLWLKKIPTDLSGLKNPVICINHFPKSKIITMDRCCVQGELVECRRKIPKLKEGTVPSIFGNDSQTEEEQIEENVEEKEEAVYQSIFKLRAYKESKTVKSLKDIQKHVSEKVKWVCLSENNTLILCFMDTDDIPSVAGSIIVNDNLEFRMFVDAKIVSKALYPKNIARMKDLDDLDTFLDFIEICSSKQKAHGLLDLDDIIDAIEKHFDESEFDDIHQNVSYICEQMKLMTLSKNNRRYSGTTLVFAMCAYLQSNSGYSLLYKSKMMCIPHPRTLRKMIESLSFLDNSSSLSNSTQTTKYLKSQIDSLSTEERVVNLHMDEIHIDPKLNLKGNAIYGVADLNSEKAAMTAQVFVIKSRFCKYKDIVSIVPVNSLTANNFKVMISDVIKYVQSIGFQIEALKSDNNVVNRRAFELLSPSEKLKSRVIHPLDASRQLFVIFDTSSLYSDSSTSQERKEVNKRTSNNESDSSS